MEVKVLMTFLALACFADAFVLKKDDTTSSPIPKTNIGCPSEHYNSTTTMQIFSPNYPNEYGNNQECLYIITVPEGNVVRIHFSQLYTEYKYDKIDVFDGHVIDAKLLGSHSGAEIPDDHYSSGNTMTIRFTSDPTYTYRGFMATYFAITPKNSTSDQ